MAEHHNGHPATAPQSPAASLARLRSLARSGFDVRTFLRNISLVEVAAMMGLVGLVAVVVVIYFAWILPDQVRRLQLSNEVAANRVKIEELSKQAGDPASLTAAYQQVHESLDAFRGQTLQPRTAGRLQIINLVNDLTRETRVKLDGPIVFETRNLANDLDENNSGRRTRDSEDEVRSYPSLSMALTISGTYPQIRSFLARFETGRQFAVIESVAISTNDESDRDGSAGRRGDDGDSGAITLDVTMTAYFQPDAPAVSGLRQVLDTGGAR